MPIPALAFAIPGALKAGLGMFQTIKGAKMKPERPEYDIPKSAQEELAMSRMEAGGRMPGIGYAENRLQQGKASGLYALRRGATNSSQLLSGLSGIQMQANIAERGLLQSESEDQYRRLANLRRSLGVNAQYQDKKWQLNKFDPYVDEARTKAALTQSGLTNMFTGIGEGVSGMMDAGRYNAEMDYMKALSRNFKLAPGLMSDGYNRDANG